MSRVEGGADATDGLQESLSLSLLSKATVKYWAIRAFCQRESGVMGWGWDWESRGLKLDSWTQRHKGTTAKNPARAHTNTQTAAVGKTQIQVTHSLPRSLPPSLTYSHSLVLFSLSLSQILHSKQAMLLHGALCLMFQTPNLRGLNAVSEISPMACINSH